MNIPNPVKFLIEDEDPRRCCLLDPDDFLLYPIPFCQPEPCPFRIPDEYQQGD
jgi:hypothetical protein